MIVSFFVPGIPSAQGSKRFMGTRNGKGIMLDTNPQLKSWRGAVAQACPMEAPLTGPIKLSLEFCYPRPKNHYGRKNKEPYLKPDAPIYKTSAPDLDKLVRAVGDSLTGVAYIDDAQVAELHVKKTYTCQQAGVFVQIEAIRGGGCERAYNEMQLADELINHPLS